MDQTRDWIVDSISSTTRIRMVCKHCSNVVTIPITIGATPGGIYDNLLICEHTNGKRAPFMKRVRTKLASLVLRDV